MIKKTLEKTLMALAFVAMLFGTKVFAQSDGKMDNAEFQMIKSIYEALIDGNCSEAQQHYDAWKIYAGTYDQSIENLIASCMESNTAVNTEKTAIVPGTLVMISRKALANQISWEEAKEVCSNLYLNGSNSWRLPTKSELYAIYASEVLNVKSKAKAKHVFIWGEMEGTKENPRYPALDLKTGTIKYASKVSTIGCFCVNDNENIVIKDE